MYFSSDGGQTWALDMSTGAEMDACDARPLGTGQQQVWCIGYYGSGNFSSKVYSTIYGGVTVTPTPTALATQTASQTPTPTSTSTSPPASTSTSMPTSTSLPTYPPTSTRLAPTASSTATATPTQTQAPPTPTQCAMTFVDVPLGSTFYSYVRCLACRGIISGYQDDTFRPNNNVTRGQLSKIISNSAGYSDPQPARTFEDVPVGSTFQVYIGRLASRGSISGYPCGGSNEQCVPPDNLPYFRPNAGASRGQTSKIVSNAAIFNDPPGAQMFEDVLPGSAFYDYVQRLASRDILNGYPCGGAGEPCVPPGNMPYFRPGANVTRGQSAKIVSNTFFPGCQTP